MRVRSSLVIALGLLLLAAPAAAQDVVPTALQNVDVEERLGNLVPLDVPFKDENGREVRLRDYLSPDRPVLLVPAYYECPMLCNLVFNGLIKVINEMSLTLGTDYRVVTFSINPKETAEDAARRQRGHLQALGKPDAGAHWSFLTGEEPSIRAVADAIGFKYTYDAATGQYAHSAAMVALTPEGKVSRYLYGIEFPSKDTTLALVEASGGKVGTSFDRFLLNCYQYDPAKRTYGLYIKGFLQTGGLLVFLALAILLGRFWYREFKGSGKVPGEPTTTAQPSGEAS